MNRIAPAYTARTRCDVQSRLDHNPLTSANFDQPPNVITVCIFNILETLACLRDVIAGRQMTLGNQPAQRQLDVMTGGAHCGRGLTAIDLHLKGLFHGDLIALVTESAVPPLDSSALSKGHLLMVLRVMGGRFHYDGKSPREGDLPWQSKVLRMRPVA